MNPLNLGPGLFLEFLVDLDISLLLRVVVEWKLLCSVETDHVWRWDTGLQNRRVFPRLPVETQRNVVVGAKVG